MSDEQNTKNGFPLEAKMAALELELEKIKDAMAELGRASAGSQVRQPSENGSDAEDSDAASVEGGSVTETPVDAAGQMDEIAKIVAEFRISHPELTPEEVSELGVYFGETVSKMNPLDIALLVRHFSERKADSEAVKAAVKPAGADSEDAVRPADRGARRIFLSAEQKKVARGLGISEEGYASALANISAGR